MPAFGLEPGSAFIVIASTTAIIWTTLIFAVRLFMRIKINGPFGWDDHCCTAGTIVALIYSVIVLIEVNHGLGQSTSTDLGLVPVLNWINRMFYVIGLALGKVSTTLLITRITRTKEHLIVGYGLLVTLLVLMTASVALLAFECDLPTPWSSVPPSHCINRWHLWLSITILCFLLEAAVFAAAHFLVRDLQMPLREKTTILFAFGVRIVVVPPSIVRLLWLHAALYDTRLINNAKGAILSLVVIHLSVITATIPCSRPFLSAFSIRARSRRSDQTLTARRRATTPPSRRSSIFAIFYFLLPWREGYWKGKEGLEPDFRPDWSYYHASVEAGVSRKASDALRRPLSRNADSSQSGIVVEQTVQIEFQDVGQLLGETSTVPRDERPKSRSRSGVGEVARKTSKGSRGSRGSGKKVQERTEISEVG